MPLRFDTDKFILCVQENTAIWCVGSKEHSNKELRNLSWDLVGRHMYEDKWPNMTDAKYRVKVMELKTKWKHIRDGFTRHLQLQYKKKGKSKSIKYGNADALGFLVSIYAAGRPSFSKTSVTEVEEDDDFENSPQPEEEEEQEKEEEEAIKRNTRIRVKSVESREKENTSQSEEEQDQEKEYIKQNTRIRIKSVEPREKENTSQPEEEQEQEYIKQNTRIRIKNVEPRETENTSQPEEEQEYIKQNTRIRIKSVESRENKNGSEPKGMFRKRKQTSCSSSQSELNETSDDDDGYKLFFLSLLPEYRKLNDRQKLEYRLHILQFFCDLQ